jgi:hypothetical protein
VGGEVLVQQAEFRQPRSVGMGDFVVAEIIHAGD